MNVVNHCVLNSRKLINYSMGKLLICGFFISVPKPCI